MFFLNFSFTRKNIKYIITSVLFVFVLSTIGVAVVLNNNKTITTSANIDANNYTNSVNQLKINTIVVDAGHGEPDGGAVSYDGVKESDINLQIALKLEEVLLDEGFDVIMTRVDENNIAPLDKQTTIREMKVADIDKRIEITNSSNADVLISIHMNKFSATKYRGWQTFYKSGSDESKRLAESIQSEIKKSVQLENNRTALKIENIKLIDNSTIPAVIVECGFLSNEDEKQLLQQEDYQNKLVDGILNGILNFNST